MWGLLVIMIDLNSIKYKKNCVDGYNMTKKKTDLLQNTRRISLTLFFVVLVSRVALRVNML